MGFDVGNFLRGLHESAGAEPEPEGWKVDDAADQVASLIPEADPDGNVDSPLLQRLRTAWQGHWGGSLPYPEVAAALDEARSELEGRLEMLAQSVQHGLDQANDPVHRKVEQAFSEQLQAVASMQVFLEIGGAESDVRPCMARVQDATNRMAAIFRRFEDEVVDSLTYCCPFCYRRCNLGEKHCPHCDALLPMVRTQLSTSTWSHLSAEGALPTQGRVTTPNFDRIEQALEQWRDRTVSDAEFVEQIKNVIRKFVNHRASVQKDRSDVHGMPHVSAEERDPYLALLDQIEHTLEEGLGALAQMRTGVMEGHTGVVDEAFRAFEANNEALVQAYFAAEALKGE